MPEGISKIEGAGNYDEGTTCTVKVTPANGYIVTSINGISTDGETGTKTMSFNVASDVTISATAVKCYYIGFDKNGDTGTAPSSIGPCLANVSYELPTPTGFKRTFEGWSTTSGGAVDYDAGDSFSKDSFYAGQVFTLYAVFPAQFKVKIYDNHDLYPPDSGIGYINGYTGDNRTFSVENGVSQNLPPASQMMSPPSGYVFGGWNTKSDGTGTDFDDEGDLSELYGGTPGEMIGIYAQWRRPNVKITRANVAGSSAPSVANVGTLSLYSAADNYTNPLSVTAADGSIYYEAAQGTPLRVRCSLSDADFGWRALGVQTGVDSDEQPVYAAEYDFTKGASDVDIDYYFQAKALRTVSVESKVDGGGTLPSGCSVEIISPSAPDSDGKYYEGRTITVSITKAAGWKPKFVRYANTDNILAPGSDVDLAADATEFTFDVADYNMLVVVYFARTEFTVGVSKHSTSQSAITSVSVTRNSSSVTSAEYNDEVTFEAVVASDYQFEAWYTKPNGGVRYSNVNPLVHTVQGDITLYARAKVTVEFDIDYPTGTDDEDKTCSLKIAGSQVSVPHSMPMALGQTISYELVAGTHSVEEGGETVSKDWDFNGWFNGDEVVPLPKSGSFTQPADTPGGTYTAKFVEDATKNLAVYVKIHTGPTTNFSPSTRAAKNLLTFSPLRDPRDADFRGLSEASSGEDSHVVKMTANGVMQISITADPFVIYQGVTYYFNSFAKSFTNIDTLLPSSSDVLSSNAHYEFLLNEDRVKPAEGEEDEDKAIYVFYGEPKDVKVSLGIIGDANSGNVEVVEVQKASGDTSTPSIALDRRSATAKQGSTLVVRAIAMNGYKCVGWFLDKNASNKIYVSANASVAMSTPGTIYAKFVEDTHFLCEWEGSHEWEGSQRNKVMEWCSKTYSAPQPINPSACRVDATGYRPNANLTLSVEMFSSPDAEPTATATLENITSQDARRLPIKRRERFMRVCVKSDAEVDGIFVATSMGGLAT